MTHCDETKQSPQRRSEDQNTKNTSRITLVTEILKTAVMPNQNYDATSYPTLCPVFGPRSDKRDIRQTFDNLYFIYHDVIIYSQLSFKTHRMM